MKILMVEDNPDDAAWIQASMREVSGDKAECVGADTVHRALELIKYSQFDVVLLDLSLPDSRGVQTLKRMKASLSACPVIVLTGLDDEEVGRLAVHEGAEDYLVKDDCTVRSLHRAIVYAMERFRLRAQLQEAHTEIHLLRGMLPICAQCKKIRDAQGHWERLEAYLQSHSDATFTHSICPDCAQQYTREIEAGGP